MAMSVTVTQRDYLNGKHSGCLDYQEYITLYRYAILPEIFIYIFPDCCRKLLLAAIVAKEFYGFHFPNIIV